MFSLYRSCRNWNRFNYGLFFREFANFFHSRSNQFVKFQRYRWNVKTQISLNSYSRLNFSHCRMKNNSICDCNDGIFTSECDKKVGDKCDKENLQDYISDTSRRLWEDTNKNLELHYFNHTKSNQLLESTDLQNQNKGSGMLTLLQDTMNQPLTVCVEGNIGSGKTTFLKHFKKIPNVCVLDEPISKWRDCQGYNLLDLMYKDPRKWSLCFQSYVQLTMLDLHTRPIVQPYKMMERSIYSAQYCFVQNLRDEGLMDDPQFTVLSEWFNFSLTNLPIKVDLIVYLRTDPEIAYERIEQRGRSEENSIKLEYLQRIHKRHEDWLVHNQKLLPCPVLTIDANTSLADMTLHYQLCEDRMFQNVAVANF